MGFKNKDEFLDGLFDHLFPSDGPEPTDEDKEWFEHAAKFFDQFDATDTENTSGGNATTNPPRRRRSTETTTPPRRRSRQTASRSSSDDSYGSRLFFG